LLAENHSIICAKTRFVDVEKSIKFPLEIIPLVSSANGIGSAMEGYFYKPKIVGALK